MMMKKILSTCSWPKFFLHYTLFGGKHPFLRENKLFMRDTVYSFAKSRWSPGFQGVGYELGSTE